MDHSPQCKSKDYKASTRKYRRKSSQPEVIQSFLRQNTKSTKHKIKFDKLDLIKSKKFCSSKGAIKKIKGQGIDCIQNT